MNPDPKPKARDRLVASEHTKLGHDFVTLLNLESLHVALLEPWEYRVLRLCDGQRDEKAIHSLLSDTCDFQAVVHCLDFLAKEQLTFLASTHNLSLQAVFQEWHKDGRRMAGFTADRSAPPFDVQPSLVRVGLEPTVALPDQLSATFATIEPKNQSVLDEIRASLDQSGANLDNIFCEWLDPWRLSEEHNYSQSHRSEGQGLAQLLNAVDRDFLAFDEHNLPGDSPLVVSAVPMRSMPEDESTAGAQGPPALLFGGSLVHAQTPDENHEDGEDLDMIDTSNLIELPAPGSAAPPTQAQAQLLVEGLKLPTRRRALRTTQTVAEVPEREQRTYNRCPSCFAMVETRIQKCFACGFHFSR